MSYRNSVSCIVAVSFFSLSFVFAPSSPKRGPIVRQVDNILVQSGDPEPLFDFLTRTLQLPVAWPITVSTDGESAGAGAGNVVIEIFCYPDTVQRRRSGDARFSGIAFEPYPLDHSMTELQTRGIRYNQPETYNSTLPDGTEGPLWTTVGLTELSKPDLLVFLREYSPAFLNPAIRRRQLGNRLTLDRGGPLGILSVKEIVISTEDMDGDRARWKTLLMPSAPDSATDWQAGEGPSVRLVRGTARIQRIVFAVASIEKAKAFLEKNQILGSASGVGLAIDPSRIQGLDMRFVQR